MKPQNRDFLDYNSKDQNFLMKHDSHSQHVVHFRDVISLGDLSKFSKKFSGRHSSKQEETVFLFRSETFGQIGGFVKAALDLKSIIIGTIN